ncbi:uncharacterized protein LOC112126894 isoform X2 [Cimex lectularius]|nr:uncharacterized protein LOC112126894 isoform X2 [Cimex lectularius]XP_024082629.1 uncharacterized protein LOC112126894 isoform X2 [Cimex lectularius]
MATANFQNDKKRKCLQVINSTTIYRMLQARKEQVKGIFVVMDAGCTERLGFEPKALKAFDLQNKAGMGMSSISRTPGETKTSLSDVGATRGDERRRID